MTLLIFLLILSILILIHEFGHFIVAKWSGVRVEEFALGFPPCLWSKKVGETRYSLNSLPIGGYVRLYGEDMPQETDRRRSFFAQPMHIKLAVALAGALMNLVLGVVAFTLLYMRVGIPVSTQEYTFIAGVVPGSPADKADLKPLDRILTIDGKEIKSREQVQELAKTNADRQIEITVDRTPLTALANMAVEQKAKETVGVFVTPEKNPGPNRGPLGIAIDTIPITKTEFVPGRQMVVQASRLGVKDSLSFSKQIILALGSAVKNLVVHRVVPEEVSGPVGIFQTVGTVAKTGFLPLLSLVGILSINLAVVNAFPFPGLDGARALFVLVHAVTRQKIAPVIEKNIHLVGLAVLLLLVLLITAHDIQRLF